MRVVDKVDKVVDKWRNFAYIKNKKKVIHKIASKMHQSSVK